MIMEWPGKALYSRTVALVRGPLYEEGNIAINVDTFIV